MNTITFSNYEASTTGLSTMSSGVGYNVEIKDEENEWSVWGVATIHRGEYEYGKWILSHVRIVGKEDVYPSMGEAGAFLTSLEYYLDGIMNKLIPSQQNAHNEQV